ncbi:hypothetical protein M0804_006439 [Polistes exclamans]|nr:hypothetical protein M0804_006439 [Polistes exclamans]
MRQTNTTTTLTINPAYFAIRAPSLLLEFPIQFLGIIESGKTGRCAAATTAATATAATAVNDSCERIKKEKQSFVILVRRGPFFPPPPPPPPSPRSPEIQKRQIE